MNINQTKDTKINKKKVTPGQFSLRKAPRHEPKRKLNGKINATKEEAKHKITPCLSNSSLFYQRRLKWMEQILADCLHVNAYDLGQEMGDRRTRARDQRNVGPHQCPDLLSSICRWKDQIPSFQRSLSQWKLAMLVKTWLTVADRRCRWLSESMDCHNWMGTLL